MYLFDEPKYYTLILYYFLNFLCCDAILCHHSKQNFTVRQSVSFYTAAIVELYLSTLCDSNWFLIVFEVMWYSIRLIHKSHTRIQEPLL
jgi:hypothetical protein